MNIAHYLVMADKNPQFEKVPTRNYTFGFEQGASAVEVLWPDDSIRFVSNAALGPRAIINYAARNGSKPRKIVLFLKGVAFVHFEEGEIAVRLDTPGTRPL